MQPRRPRSLLLFALLFATTASTHAAPFALDEERSLFYGILEPAGVIGSATGQHVVESDDWVTRLCVEPGAPTTLRGRFVVDVTDIELDTERALAAEDLEDPPGGLFSGLIEREMKGRRGLDVQTYPTIEFRIDEVREGPGETYAFIGPLTLHGTTREIAIPVDISRTEDGALVYDGRFTVEQSEYGIRPLSIPGVLTIGDDLELRVRIVGEPLSGHDCPFLIPGAPGEQRATRALAR